MYYKNGKLFSGPKKRVRYYKGEKFTGISQSNKLAYQAGYLFTGIFALDGKRYVDGRLFTGISSEDGAKYENGVIVDGSIVVENSDKYSSPTSFGSEIGLADTIWEFSDTQLKSLTTEDVKKWVTVPVNTVLEVSYSKALSQVKPGDIVTITFIAINQGKATTKKIMVKVVTEQTAFESALSAYELALKAASEKKVEVVTVNTDTASLAELKLAIEKMNEMIANVQNETAQQKEKDKVIKAYEEMLRAANDANVNVNEFKINTDTASLAEIKAAIEKMNEAIAKAKGTLAEETAQALKLYEEALKAANDAKVNINEFKINKDAASLAELKLRQKRFKKQSKKLKLEMHYN